MLVETHSLDTHHEHVTVRLFERHAFDTNSVVNYLLPLKRNLEAIDKLRNVKPYEHVKMSTDRLKNCLFHTVPSKLVRDINFWFLLYNEKVRRRCR